MHQTVRLSAESPKMSACGDFVEHIWKPGSCKNCFCLRSDHQLAPGQPQPRAGHLPPPPRLPPRPDTCRLEDEAVNGSPYSKPTIAVKPTMMSADASDVWAEANLSADVSQVRLTNACGIFTGAALAVTGWLAGGQGGLLEHDSRAVASGRPTPRLLLPNSCPLFLAALPSVCPFRLRTISPVPQVALESVLIM